MTLLKDKKYKSKRVQGYKSPKLFYFFTFVLLYLASSVADAQLIRRETIQAGIIFCEDAGGNDTYTCPTPTPALAAYDSKILTIFRPNTNNTGTATLNISGLGAVTIVAFDGSTLTNNALLAGQRYILVHNGTNFVLYNPGAGGGGAGLSGLTDNFILKALGTTGAEISSINDDGAGTISIGTVTGNRHEQLFSSPTAVHQHTWPAVTGNIAQTTGTLTSGNLAQFDASGNLIDAGIPRTRSIQAELYAPATATATCTGCYYFRVPASLNGTDLVGVQSNTITAGTTGLTSVQITKCTAQATSPTCGAGTTTVSMLSTVLSIDSGETSSSTAATAAVISATAGVKSIATGNILRFDVTAINTTPAQGLIVNLDFQIP